MFDQWLEESLGDPGGLLGLAADNHATERRAGCRTLVLAAAWADCHGETSDPEQVGARSSVLVERFVRMGPLGTPLVAETCPASLALAQQSSVVAARLLIGDALAIRHRLPQLWERVKAGEVMAWKAREGRPPHLGAHRGVGTGRGQDRDRAGRAAGLGPVREAAGRDPVAGR